MLGYGPIHFHSPLSSFMITSTNLAQWCQHQHRQILQQEYLKLFDPPGINALLHWINETTPEQREQHPWIQDFFNHFRQAVRAPHQEQASVLERFAPHFFFNRRSFQMLPKFESHLDPYPFHQPLCDFFMEEDFLNWLQQYYTPLLTQDIHNTNILVLYQWLSFYLPQHPFLPTFKNLLKKQQALYHFNDSFLEPNHPHAPAQIQILSELSSLHVSEHAPHQPHQKPYGSISFWTEAYWDFWEYDLKKKDFLTPWLTALKINEPEHLAMHYQSLPDYYQCSFRSFLIHEAHQSPSVLMSALHQVIQWDTEHWLSELDALRSNPALAPFIESSLSLSLQDVITHLREHRTETWTQSYEIKPLDLRQKPQAIQKYFKTQPAFLRLRHWLHHWQSLHHQLNFEDLSALLLISPPLHPHDLWMASKKARQHTHKALPLTCPGSHPSKHRLLSEGFLQCKRLQRFSHPRLRFAHPHLQSFYQCPLSASFCLNLLLEHPHREAWLSLSTMGQTTLLDGLESSMGAQKVHIRLARVRQEYLEQQLHRPKTSEIPPPATRRL